MCSGSIMLAHSHISSPKLLNIFCLNYVWEDSTLKVVRQMKLWFIPDQHNHYLCEDRMDLNNFCLIVAEHTY
jgi:hypothetical protein